MNIGIIGTSPIMLIEALKLSKDNKVKIFDPSSNTGGAWSVKRVGKNLYAPRQTNAVVPTSFKEERKILKLNKFIAKKFNINIEKFDNYIFKQNYKPKNIFFYDLSFFYEKVKKKIQIKKKRVHKILIKNKSLYLGNEKFDQVLVPYFNSINSIKNNNKVSLTSHTMFKSKHMLCLMKRKKFNKLVYEEYTDKVFDRYLINGKKNYFVGRVSREYKKKNTQTLLKNTDIRFLEKKNIKKNIFFYYKNFKRDKKQINNLIKNKKNKNLKFINTKQFATSLIKVLESYG